MNCSIRQRLVHAAGIWVALVISGCSQAPTFDVLGSVFPAWLFCLAIGVLLTAIARWLLVRKGIQLLYPLLTYPSLAAVFIFAMWLVFFW
jgi:fructose-specific phosphotransferase system IIC component